jgi:hypothetical protein
MKKNKLRDRVEHVLTKAVHLRDNDARLTCVVWAQELKEIGLDYSRIGAGTLMNLYVDGTLSTPDTITRIRRKLQEVNEELRGEKYAKRQRAAERWQENYISHIKNEKP